MKKIINGKMYDTETAEHLYGHILNRGELDYVDEDLYRKNNGEYFKAGQGGPFSDYGWGDAYCRNAGGPTIIPLSEGEARYFIERFGDTEDYERIFGTPEE